MPVASDPWGKWSPQEEESQRKVPYSVFDDLLLAIVFFASLKRGKKKITKNSCAFIELEGQNLKFLTHPCW